MTAIQNLGTPATLVAYAHAALYSPAISTMETALEKNFLPPFPGLTLQVPQETPTQL
jgi:hypothetical protein